MADEIRRLIRVRTQKGARFKRDGFGKKSQISDSWRKPRGQHNKQREQKKAKGALPKPGFGSPVSVRGMHPSGFYEVLVYSVDDLDGLNAKTHAVRISANVGNRKRSAIQEKALSAGLKVLNAREAPATSRTQPAPLKAKEEIVQKKEEQKKAKPKPRKKEEPREIKEEKKETVKPAAKKKVKAETAEGKPKKTKKPKVQKGKAEDSSEEKPRKSTKPKAEATKAKKEKPKTAKKTAARQKKKTSTGVKDNE